MTWHQYCIPYHLFPESPTIVVCMCHFHFNHMSLMCSCHVYHLLHPQTFSFTPFPSTSNPSLPSSTITYAINPLYTCIPPLSSIFHLPFCHNSHFLYPALSTPPTLLYYPLIPILLCLPASSVTAVRLPDGLSFVVYEFWDGEEEWKRWVFNHIWLYVLKIIIFNLKPKLLANVCHSCLY